MSDYNGRAALFHNTKTDPKASKFNLKIEFPDGTIAWTGLWPNKTKEGDPVESRGLPVYGGTLRVTSGPGQGQANQNPQQQQSQQQPPQDTQGKMPW
jgi:hypothetical protein